MNRPIHFEIPADDPARGIAFYESVFGWKITQWGEMPYYVVATGAKDQPGIDGGLMPRKHPDQPVVNTVDVVSLEATLAAVEKAGGQCVVPKMAIPGVGWLAYCKDTERNIFGIMQTDSAAA